MTTKKNKNKKCQHCKKLFTPRRSTAKFCSDSCRQTFNRGGQSRTVRATSPDAKINKLLNTGFMLFVLSQCERAQTIQILDGVDFVNLYDVYACKQRLQFNMENDIRLDLSHYVPVMCAGGKIGTLHPNNLGIWPAGLNRSFKNGSLPFGVSIPVENLKIELSCKNKSEAFKKLKIHYQSELINLVTQRKPAETMRYKQIKWVMKRDSSFTESYLTKLSQSDFKVILDNMGYLSTSYKGDGSVSLLSVLQRELDRHSRLYPETNLSETIEILSWLSDAVSWGTSIPNIYCRDFTRAKTLLEACYRAAILHAHKELALMTISLCNVLERYSDNPVPNAPSKLKGYVNSLPVAKLHSWDTGIHESFVTPNFELEEYPF
ncbi:hypothetical protein [Aeromonas hydrophila]|uniref:hypothetical protein n=1 Tax=Aeromonas hydrophila TaxID=644 RepID=UPI0030CFAD5D